MRLLQPTVIFLAGLICTGCVVQPGIPELAEYPPELVSGELAFNQAIPATPELDLLSVSHDMEAFLDETNTLRSRIAFVRFQRIMNGLTERGYFQDSYIKDATYSAADTFARGQGNCLGFTNMFVALARAADIPARYQLIESDPRWDVSAGMLVRSNHINLELGQMRTIQGISSRVIVDFNQTQPEGLVRSRVISDEHAASLFYTNIAVKHMMAGRMVQAFANLRRAIEMFPANKIAWNNLGVLYSKMDKFAPSAEAFELVLEIDPSERTALVGLATVLQPLGRVEEAEQYAAQVRRYRDKNPYYHYAVATDAYKNASFDQALVAIEAAISLKSSDARFFAFRAEVAKALGDESLATRSLRIAKRKFRAQDPSSVSASYYSAGS